jgi:hypothetical protein
MWLSIWSVAIMEIEVYLSESYLVFESNGVVVYDFPAKDFSFYQPQLIIKQWYTPKVKESTEAILARLDL